MAVDPPPYESELRNTQRIGYAAIVVTAGLTTGLAHFTTISSKITTVLHGPISIVWLLSLLQLLVLTYVLVLALLWYLSTDWELSLFTRHLSMPPHRLRDNAIIILGGAVLGLAIYFSDRIVLFTSIYLVCDALAFVGTKDVDDAVALSLEKRRHQGPAKDDSEREILSALEEYYNGRPQLARIAVSSAAKLVVLGIAVYARWAQPTTSAAILVDSPNVVTCIAYALLLVTGVSSEIPITIWRIKREARVRQAVLAREFSSA